jgi:GT2 family glycosyltransferase
MTKIAICLIAYNGMPLVKKCIARILHILKLEKDLNYTFTVIDNCSNDGSEEYFKSINNFITYKRYDINIGYANALTNYFNSIVRLQKPPEYIFLINQDVIIEDNCISELLHSINNKQNIIAAMPELFMLKDPIKINSFGNNLHFLGFGFCLNKYLTVDKLIHVEKKRETREIFYCSGSVCLLSVEKLMKIWDNRFILIPYYEDLEIGIMARMLGYKSIISHKCKAFHDYEFFKPNKIGKLFWGRYSIIFSYYSISLILYLLPMLIFMEIFSIAISPILYLKRVSEFLKTKQNKTLFQIKIRRKIFGSKANLSLLNSLDWQIDLRDILRHKENLFINNVFSKFHWITIKLLGRYLNLMA